MRRRLQSARPATDGRFIFHDLPAGDYLLAALTDADPASWRTVDFLSQLAPLALRVSVREGEAVVQNLAVREP